MPEQMLVGEFLPPYFISQLEDSIIISGSFNFGDFRFIYAWEIEVDDAEVSSYRQLFIIPYPAQHELKLNGFTKDKQPIVEASFLQQFHQSLQVFNPSYEKVEAAVVTSWRVLFVMPSQNIAKLIGFTMDDDPIVVVDIGHEIVHTLQVYDRPSQQFHTLGIIEERVRQLIRSPGASSTLSFSPGTSSTPNFSPTPPTPPNYYGGSSSNTECSNCKHLFGRIKVLQATLEMYMHPEQHILDSTALLHDLNNDMENIGLE
ncbi:hypothetical protein Tco_0671258 [Tanacetum coccineum]